MVQKNIQVICRIITSGTLILSRRIGSHVEFDFRALRNWARARMVEWNGIFQLFRFSGILGQPCEVHLKFRNEIPENVCSICSQTRNFRNFWSNGKRPSCSLENVRLFDHLTLTFSCPQQCVQINQTCSSLQTIKSGVPQGSILGPLFFILYIKDLPKASKLNELLLFADDTSIFFFTL